MVPLVRTMPSTALAEIEPQTFSWYYDRAKQINLVVAKDVTRHQALSLKKRPIPALRQTSSTLAVVLTVKSQFCFAC